MKLEKLSALKVKRAAKPGLGPYLAGRSERQEAVGHFRERR
jgi:hypothetical protein